MRRGVLTLIILEGLFFAAATVALLTVLTERTTATNCNPIRSFETISPGSCNFIYKSERDYITYPGVLSLMMSSPDLGSVVSAVSAGPSFLLR
ncbi:MAG TPA: hypothetical protein VKC61_14885 [Pyrinomonadaceae bacterium]|nr:hypothetical protein [Pyrinomonadaceae bacterium]